VTVLEAIQRSSEFLAKKGVGSPRLNAELLLAQVLGIPRMRLYLDFERRLGDTEVDALRALVMRRSRREPLQHILGQTSFCGLEFKVSRDVLVPRPETELLAERAWEFLGGCGGEPSVLDYGTGSGCLAVTLAVRVASARITAVDVSPAALEIARENARTHGVADRIEFVEDDGLNRLIPGLILIVGNPPYIPTADISGLAPEVKDFDPHVALDGGDDGLEHYRRLAVRARNCLVAGGRIMLEFGDGQGPSIQRAFQEQNWVVEALVEDYNRKPRIIVAGPGIQPV
jgi:release factor glutamine methyltransferase